MKILFLSIATIIGVSIIPLANTQAQALDLKMVFVPASEKGDDNDYVNLIKIIEKLSSYKISPIKVTDYNAAVEAMRSGRVQIGWFGGKTYIHAAEIADAEAFAAGIRKGAKDATYFAYFVVLQIIVSLFFFFV